MELSQAIRLIEKGVLKSTSPQRWADLGAGEGMFTRALGSVLPPKSSVLAIDRNASALKAIERNVASVTLQTQVTDFASLNWGEGFDGLLMANALHYERNQSDFLLRLKNKLLPDGRLIIVEYERQRANAWVPYPIGLKKLHDIGAKAGFSSITQLAESPSIYDNATIYSAVLL